jgi:hypothetical protein
MIMTTKKDKKRSRTAREALDVMGIQRRIDTDYAQLVRDYGKMGSKLMKRPVTRIFLGGIALSVIAPYILRLLRNPEVQTFVRDNVEHIRSRVDGLIHSSSELDTLNQ